MIVDLTSRFNNQMSSISSCTFTFFKNCLNVLSPTRFYMYYYFLLKAHQINLNNFKIVQNARRTTDSTLLVPSTYNRSQVDLPPITKNICNLERKARERQADFAGCSTPCDSISLCCLGFLVWLFLSFTVRGGQGLSMFNWDRRATS